MIRGEPTERSFIAARAPECHRALIRSIYGGVYKKEFFAQTRDQAVTMAAEHFAVDPGKLEVAELPVVVDGMGDRKCFVVSIEGTSDQQPPEQGRSDRGDRDRGGRGGRDRRGGDRGGGDRGGDRGRGRGDRDRRGGDRGGGDRGGGDRGGGGGDRGRGPRPPRGDRPEGVDHERLEQVAREAAEKVKTSGQPLTLPWMNSKERWVVHNYLKDVDGVTSVSEGEGAEKRLKVLPE